LTQEERQRLWFVSWNEKEKEFTREFTPSLAKLDQLDEHVRLGLNAMSLILKDRIAA
jgi:hypothetical protein